MEKPFSQACENNKRPILHVLERAFANTKRVLEVGSGTGQHAVFFAEHLPHLHWHCSDQAVNHAGIAAWLMASSVDNIEPPVSFTVGVDHFPQTAEAGSFDGVFSANTAHIMQKAEIQSLMSMIAENLPHKGVFCQYGPFTQNGEFSSQSNLDFHQSLLARGYGGYRDIDELKTWAPSLQLQKVHTMPANNLVLEWHKN